MRDFKDFTNLTSLSLRLGYGSCHGNYRLDIKSFGEILNGLHLKSLDLTSLRLERLNESTDEDDIWSKTKLMVPGPVTTPNLMQSLVHLTISYQVETQYAEYLLFHLRLLRTLYLDCISESK